MEIPVEERARSMKGRTGRRVLFGTLIVLLIAGAVAYKLYEPQVHYRTWHGNWQLLPAGDYPVTSTHAPGWEAVASRADAWLTQTRRQLNVPAVSAAVSVNGELVWAGAAGYADVDAGTPATTGTAFRIGSSSKAVTSVAMGTLIDRQEIDLDAPVSRYVKELGQPLAPITTRQAMSHMGGVREYGPCLCFPISEYFSRRHFGTQREALKPFERSALLFSPGQRFAYSSYGYNLSGAVIEGITQQGFGEYLASRVFAPLAMGASRADDGRPLPHEAKFYNAGMGYYLESFRIDNTNRLPSGGILATPSDLVRIGEQMIRPSLFSEATRDLLMQPQTLADGRANPQGYALGWRVGELPILDGSITTRGLHHHGMALGSVSHFVVYPEYGVVVSLMLNANQVRFGPAADRLVDLFIAAPTT